MIIPLHKIVSDYNLNIQGVIHIGAHYGQEYSDYEKQGIKNMMFFEPVADNYNRLIENLPKNENVKAYNIALGNELGEREMYIEKVKGQSCSFLEPGTHLELSPHIKFTDKETVGIAKLDQIAFDRTQFNMINIDVQGFELEVFKGGEETLKGIDIVYTEVNFEDVYKGCCRVEELDIFLGKFGFVRVLTKDSRVRKDHNTWGDALYIKQKDFTSFMKTTYTFNQEEYDKNKGWEVLDNLYKQNFILADKIEQKIPKKIHQIWLGSPVPEKYKQWMDSWKVFNPDWVYKLWTDNDLKEENIHISDWCLFNGIQNMGQKSDYLRYHILNQFGGVYVDTDFECLKSFDSLLYAEFLAGVSYDASPIVNIAVLGSTPNHPIIENVIETMIVKTGDTSRNVFDSTGPYFFTKSFFDVVGDYMTGVVVLPPDYFYPFPNEKGFSNRRGSFYTKKCSYAIHYWDCSWMNLK